MPLDAHVLDQLDQRLAAADAQWAARYPGDDGGRQPVHTAYVPADRFDVETIESWGAQARNALATHAPDPESFAEAIGLASGADADGVRRRVEQKLRVEPIEDLRIDFEDGYGTRPDAEEDVVATRAGQQLAQLVAAGGAPPFVGIRFKSLESSTRRRGIATVDRFLDALLERVPLPAGFLLTLPKLTHLDQVPAFAEICDELESHFGLPAGRLGFEIQVETPQAILAADGSATVARLVHAGSGRVRALHYGTYDYSAACGIAVGDQSLEHPVADHAKAVMQLAAAGTGVRLSDGSTNVLPVGDGGAVRVAWRLHARLVTRSLSRGYYQGWDLHPAQLVTRYGATYAFYRSGAPAACDRLAAYLAGTGIGRDPAAVGAAAVGVAAVDAAAVGEAAVDEDAVGGAAVDETIVDEPATAQAMASLLVRGLQCGALDEADVEQRCGLARSRLEALYRRRIG